MRLCCFFVTDGGHQVALNPKIVTRIHEMASKDLCVVYTNDGHQAIQVQGNFDVVVSAVAESMKDDESL